MLERLTRFPDKVIEYSFYLLFFLVPLFLTPFNYELFEYNKMMLTYALTVIITGSWVIKFVLNFRAGGTSRRGEAMLFEHAHGPEHHEFAGGEGVGEFGRCAKKSWPTSAAAILRTPLDIPILLFLLSQVISTFLSIDRHVSIFGYYSRFNGGLLSTISYILLYYAFVSNFPPGKIKKLLTVILTSGVLVSIYGILEHFGIDKNIWVQDVQNRVFSTLGQPNWLAAYLAILIPITIGISLQLITLDLETGDARRGAPKAGSPLWVILGLPRGRTRKFKFIYWVICIIFYATLIFSKSRSGFIGLWISLIVLLAFSLISWVLNKSQSQISTHLQAIASICVRKIKLIGICILSFIFISFFFGTPFTELNRFTYSSLFSNSQPTTYNPQPTTPIGSSIIDVGITESGVIRNIVWRGAIDIVKNYPFFGTGVETFAFAYYKFRPVEHNMTSEWDFLYNKAHNEYLNYAATTGFVGLGSYLLLIGSFIWWNINYLKYQKSKTKNTDQKSKLLALNSDFALCTLHFALFSAWLSILVTNFFGFSVVMIQLFFFLIPAISFVLIKSGDETISQSKDIIFNKFQYAISIIILFSTFYLLFSISKIWYADLYFAAGHNASQSQEYTSAYQNFRQAILLNDNEPFYYNEFSLPAAQIAAALFEEKETTASAQLIREATLSSDTAVASSPNNVNFWKTRTRVYYTLSGIDEKYLTESLSALENARILSPTDPKVVYNLAVIYDKVGKREEAMKLLQETVKLKADYRDAYLAMGLFYERDKKNNEAKKQYEFILNRINPDDVETKKKLEELK